VFELKEDYKKWYKINKKRHGRVWALLVFPAGFFVVPDLKNQLEEGGG